MLFLTGLVAAFVLIGSRNPDMSWLNSRNIQISRELTADLASSQGAALSSQSDVSAIKVSLSISAILYEHLAEHCSAERHAEVSLAYLFEKDQCYIYRITIDKEPKSCGKKVHPASGKINGSIF